jgi:hypothetical protein
MGVILVNSVLRRKVRVIPGLYEAAVAATGCSKDCSQGCQLLETVAATIARADSALR